MIVGTNRIRVHKGTGQELETRFARQGGVEKQPGFVSFQMWKLDANEEHDYSCCEPEGPALVVEPQLNTRLDYYRKRVDWQFYVSWIEWCQFAASRLTELTEWE